MFDAVKFKEAINKAGYSIEDVANILSIDVSTLYRKMSGSSDFYRREIDTIVATIPLDDPSDIFFA